MGGRFGDYRSVLTASGGGRTQRILSGVDLLGFTGADPLLSADTGVRQGRRHADRRRPEEVRHLCFRIDDTDDLPFLPQLLS